MAVWVVWSEVSYLGFYFFEMDRVHVVGVYDVPVAYLIMSLYCQLFMGVGFQPVAGWGPNCQVFRFFSNGLLCGPFR